MKIISLISLLSSLCFGIFAQSLPDKEQENFGWAVAMLPQYAIVSTMRIDFDRTIGHNNVITLSPMFSFARNSSLLFPNSDDYYYDNATQYPENISLTGGGLKFTFRHFFGDFNLNSGLYLGGGLHYRFSHVEYQEEGWIAHETNGDSYLHYEMIDKEEDFNQVGVDVILGYQIYLIDNIFLDVFGGWGIRISDYDTERGEVNHWGETIFDIGYSGYTPLMGLRLGVFF